MKNVAKCDTWCELQNPANHRVFERKLRPKPFGRGHVCLGVTHRCPPQTPVRAGRKLASRACLRARLAQKASPRRRAPRQSVVFLPSFLVVRAPSLERALRPSRVVASTALPTRPQVRRDYPLSLSISISGGKETYKDSPSNGERTGNSPA
ncbi:hypothetical protein RGQ29_000065 [Quercus rubra]|uniref:Uncharacterized protein n=1 Tax=Quercus rubra TaxID=3512 RepID=A0AAN7G4P8_QUERU|nr:hypothetical protein RGQ29_000065 [Quercus rubra]